MDAELLNDYYLGRLAAEGVDYRGDSAHEYWLGRMDARLECGPESKRCGNACIPKWKKCRASWNKPVKALAGAAALTGAGVAGTALFHPHSKMREAARGVLNPLVQGGLALGNAARGNVSGAANNVVNAASSAERFGENAKTLVEGYGGNIKGLYRRVVKSPKARVKTRKTSYGG